MAERDRLDGLTGVLVRDLDARRIRSRGRDCSRPDWPGTWPAIRGREACNDR